MQLFLTVDGVEHLVRLEFVPVVVSSYEIQPDPPDIDVISIEVGGRMLTDTEIEVLLDREEGRYFLELVEAAEKEHDDDLRTMHDY